MGYVYMITNTVNEKKYIGISIHEPEKRRIKDHLSGRGNRIIANAVKKYGKDAFTYEVLESNVFDEFLPDLEVAYIAHYNTVAPHGYNLDSGGTLAIPSGETRRKISEALKGKRFSAEHRRKLSESCRGKKLSAEHRRKLCEARKGKKPNLGKRFSAEHRRKMSESHRGKRRPEIMLVERIPARDFFFSQPPDMCLKVKRKLLYNKFPNVSKRTIRWWVQKWTS